MTRRAPGPDPPTRPNAGNRNCLNDPGFSRGWGSIVLALATLLCGLPLQAQETITSDRPGLGSGAAVVTPGVLQLEAGGEYSEAGDAQAYSLGQLLIRFGAFRGWELQTLLSSLVLTRGGGEDSEGIQDVGIGIKSRVFSSGPGGLDLSFLATLSLPTGHDDLTAGEEVPTAILLADLPLSDNAGLSVNLGFSGWLTGVEDQVSLIVTPSFSLPTSEPLGLFAGYAGFFGSSDDRHFVEGGLTWLPGPDLQLDLNGGVDTETGDFFLGVGVATRWFQ